MNPNLDKASEEAGKHISTEPNTESELEHPCRGCKKVFKRLLSHLNSKKGSTCKELYSEKEL